jgi:hypothetical protein
MIVCASDWLRLQQSGAIMTNRTALSGGSRSFACTASIGDLEPDFYALIDRTMQTIRAGIPRPDKVFGEYSAIVSLARSVAYHEGKLLELGVGRIVGCNRDLMLLPTDRAMPIVPAAIELLKRNDWSSLKGIRLPSEVHSTQSYTPDLFIANRKRHSGLIIDVKRSLASYAETQLEALRFRMLAVAAIASSWVGERQGPVLVDVGTAIIDGADEVSDHEKGVFSMSEIGDLLEVDGAGAAMAHLRTMFAERVQEELGHQCHKVLNAVGNRAHAVDDADKMRPEDADQLGSGGGKLVRLRSPDTDVKIGFARSRAIH